MIFSIGLSQPAYAVDDGEEIVIVSAPVLPDSDYDGIPDTFDAAPDSNLFTGKLKSGHDGATTVSYTMDFRNFFGDNSVYYPELGSVSVMGAALAYYAADYSNAYFTFDVPQTWEGGTASRVNGVELMQVLGFEDVVDYALDTVYDDDDLCEAVIGHRTVTYNGETKIILAIWVRGTDSTSIEEWSSNFNVGDLVRFFDQYDSVAGKSPRQSNDDWSRKTNHRGFDVCATRLLNYLKDYYLDPFVQPALDAAAAESDGEVTLAYWLTGHSRGAAVANLMASYLIDEGNEVFAYTFATPYNTANTESSAEKYDCIFNLVNTNDFIPTMPMPEWGFTRYGRTAMVAASDFTSQVESATGESYSGKFLTASEMNTLLGKFICITGENADRNNPGRILGWREVYVYHCGHTHEGETVGNYQSTTFREKGGFLGIGGISESDYNGYAARLRKYSYWHDGICQTPAYDLQVLVELLVQVAQGNTVGGGWNYLTSNKLAEKFDFDKQSLISYATKLTEPHFMDTYAVIQAQINSSGDPGALFHTLPGYTAGGAEGGRPVHTHSYTYVAYEGLEPTCTEPGLGYRFCLCSDTNADYYDDFQKNVAIPALGHTWGEPSYTWADDNGSVTAQAVCANDESHVESETVSTVFTVTTPATYDAPGVGVYTAVFTNPAFETQTRTVEIPKLLAEWIDVYVIDDNNGSFMNLYLWKDGSGASPAAWPGEAMERLGVERNGHPYYKMTVDKNLYDRLIVNNGSQQTADLNFVGDAGDKTCVIYEIPANFGGLGLPDDIFPDDAEHKTVTAPTCTEDGSVSWKGLLTDEVVTDAGEPALGHAWGKVSYVWADDNGSVTATRSCANDASHVETETAQTLAEDTSAVTCESDGERVYTAVFENPAFETQIRTVTFPALGHAWSEPTYTWAEDNSTVTAERVCANDATHAERETVDTAAAVIEASCEAPGSVTYTASFENSAFETQTKTLETAPALGHDWGEPVYTWAEDNGSVTATRVCANDASHVETETALTIFEDTVPVGCESDGERIYTAAFENPAFEPQSRTVTIPALGHSWSEPVYTWAEDNSTVTAEHVCANDPAHVESETVATIAAVTAPSCEAPGSVTYTAAFANAAFETQTKTLETDPALGHRYGDPEYTWILEEDETYTVIAAAVCLNDPAHELTEIVTAIYEVITEPTETENGMGCYTAVFLDELFTTQVKYVVLPKFGPDGYHIHVADYTKGKAAISIDSQALYEGAVSFTVWAEEACAVGIDNGDGTYTRLLCNTVDGEHFYQLTVTDGDVYLVLVFKGDEDLNGTVSLQDSTRIKRIMVESLTATALEQFAGDTNDNDQIETRDATCIARVMVGSYEIPW